MTKISGFTEITGYPSNTDVLAVTINMGSTPLSRRLPWLTAKKALGVWNGWVYPDETWSYSSAHVITVPTDATLRYAVGDRITFYQNSTYKYFYVVAVTYNSLTVCAGNDYVVENAAITLNYYSKVTTPQAFPASFGVTAPTWTSSGTGFSNQPTTNEFRFSMVGREVILRGYVQAHATTGATGIFYATFTAGDIPTFTNSAFGNALNNTDYFQGVANIVPASPLVMNTAKYDGTALFGNSDWADFTLTSDI